MLISAVLKVICGFLNSFVNRSAATGGVPVKALYFVLIAAIVSFFSFLSPVMACEPSPARSSTEKRWVSEDSLLRWVSGDQTAVVSIAASGDMQAPFCRSSSECQPGEFCVQGSCQRRAVPGCRSNIDCGVGYRCVAGTCRR